MAELYGGWCEHEDTVNINNEEYCIFHRPLNQSLIPDKDIFNLKIKERILKSIEDDDKCILDGVIFHDIFNFSELCERLPGLSLRECIFSDYVSFSGAIFSDGVDLTDAEFQQYADFSDSKLFGTVSFVNAEFNGFANFVRALFNGTAIFHKTVFEDDVDFWLASFADNTIFRNSVFNKTSNFSETEFQKNAIFNYATFIKWASFYKTVFSLEYAADFRDIVAGLSGSEQIVLFSGVDLCSLLFTSIDLEKIIFKHCNWPNKLYLERALSHVEYSEIGEVKRAEVEEVYRSLKKIAVADQDMLRASDWHYREKIMHLGGIEDRNPNSYHLRKIFSMTWWYYLSSGFGERPGKSFCILVLLFLLLVFGMIWGGVFWKTAIVASFQHVLFVKAPVFEPVSGKAVLFVTLLSKLIIPLQTALFALALRNRFRR